MAQIKDVQHFIWDFDGTLFDTYPVIIQNLRDALAVFGRDADPAEMMHWMLQTIDVAIHHYAAEFGLDYETLAAQYRQFHHTANVELAARPFPLLPKVLRRINVTGGHNYIFTHRDYHETLAYLDKYGLLQEFCETVVSSPDGFAYKPSPDAVLFLMQKYKMRTDNTVMIGDREIDLGSGRNAGILTAHIVCPLSPETLNCDFRYTDYAELLAQL